MIDRALIAAPKGQLLCIAFLRLFCDLLFFNGFWFGPQSSRGCKKVSICFIRFYIGTMSSLNDDTIVWMKPSPGRSSHETCQLDYPLRVWSTCGTSGISGAVTESERNYEKRLKTECHAEASHHIGRFLSARRANQDPFLLLLPFKQYSTSSFSSSSLPICCPLTYMTIPWACA